MKTLQIDDNYAPAINNLANIKRQSGNNQEAVDLFKRAIKADHQLVQAYIGAATSLLALGNFNEAEYFAVQGIETNSHIPGINEILGIICQNKKNYKQAVMCYQKELTVNPKAIVSLTNLGLLLLQQNNAREAIKPLTAAAAINPTDECLVLQAYQSVGQLKEAITEYKKLDIAKSQNKFIPFNLGLCCLKLGVAKMPCIPLRLQPD